LVVVMVMSGSLVRAPWRAPRDDSKLWSAGVTRRHPMM
jgi:hypothetical protein